MPGGEWDFHFNFHNKDNVDLDRYHQLLFQIRDEFEPLFKAQMTPSEGTAEWSKIKKTEEPSSEGKGGCGAGSSASASSTSSSSKFVQKWEDNVFATFTYICTRPHVTMGTSGHGVWKLMWDPTKAESRFKLHARCAPEAFKHLSNQIQCMLQSEFPDHFTLSWPNGISGYQFDNSPEEPGAGMSSWGYEGNSIGGMWYQNQNNQRGRGGGTHRGRGRSVNSERASRMVVKNIIKAMELMDLAERWEDDERCKHHLPWAYCCDCSEDVLELFGLD